jgi:hypothetical protein
MKVNVYKVVLYVPDHDDIGAEEDDDKCRGPYQRRVVPHENLRV